MLMISCSQQSINKILLFYHRYFVFYSDERYQSLHFLRFRRYSNNQKRSPD